MGSPVGLGAELEQPLHGFERRGCARGEPDALGMLATSFAAAARRDRRNWMRLALFAAPEAGFAAGLGFAGGFAFAGAARFGGVGFGGSAPAGRMSPNKVSAQIMPRHVQFCMPIVVVFSLPRKGGARRGTAGRSKHPCRSRVPNDPPAARAPPICQTPPLARRSTKGISNHVSVDVLPSRDVRPR
jgi:hypothetical protein